MASLVIPPMIGAAGMKVTRTPENSRGSAYYKLSSIPGFDARDLGLLPKGVRVDKVAPCTGRMYGASLEIAQTVGILRGDGEYAAERGRLLMYIREFFGHWFEFVGVDPEELLSSGKAYIAFISHVLACGGDVSVFDHPDDFTRSHRLRTVVATENGVFIPHPDDLEDYFEDIDISEDQKAGIQMLVPVGTEVRKGDRLMLLKSRK